MKENGMGGPSIIDQVGFAAAGLVLATFCMRSMSGLRWVAIASNVAFIAYGYLGDLAPVLLLHMVLLPNARGRSDPTEERNRNGAGPERYSFSTVCNASAGGSRTAVLPDRRV